MSPKGGRKKPSRYAVIMAGGIGTRFWPCSRQRFPKQFLSIQGPQSLLQATFRRLRGIVPGERVLVVAGREFAHVIRRQLPSLPPANLILEPEARGTAPCLALAAAHIARRHAHALMAVFPADHVVTDVPRFRRAVLTGLSVAERLGCLVTFGIPPKRPEVGYGYVEVGDVVRRATPRVHWAKRFHEKPDLSTAKKYVKAGRYLWNSGMFAWSMDTLDRAFDAHVPRIASLMRAIQEAPDEGRGSRTWRKAYRRLPAVSIDVAVLERARRIAVVDGDFGWSDVGSWAAVGEIWGTDEAGNARRGETLLLDCRDTVVFGEDRLVAMLGIDDLVVVDSPGAVLVCRKNRAQEVRRIVSALTHTRHRRLL
jgi:mannose-1-phosphate guanylyltransferase